jgi:polyhydroxyalkanoate synthesis regulator phasin
MAFLKHNEEEARSLKKELLKLTKTAIKTAPADKQRKLLEIEDLLK